MKHLLIGLILCILIGWMGFTDARIIHTTSYPSLTQQQSQ